MIRAYLKQVLGEFKDEKEVSDYCASQNINEDEDQIIIMEEIEDEN